MYLKNRRQKVKINDSISKDLEIETAVPQGTIIGPIPIFNIISEIVNLLYNGKVISYM